MAYATVEEVILEVERLRATANVVEALYLKGRNLEQEFDPQTQVEISAYFEKRASNEPWASSCGGG
jgi:hypothetical protein